MDTHRELIIAVDIIIVSQVSDWRISWTHFPGMFLSSGLLWECWDFFVSGLYSQQGWSAELFEHCDRLSLLCLVLWVNHLPPVCWSTFGKSVWMSCCLSLIYCKKIIIYLYNDDVSWHILLLKYCSFCYFYLLNSCEIYLSKLYFHFL